MKYDFTTVMDRKNMGSSKWELMKKKNPAVPDGIVPFSVADMELRHPSDITEGLKSRIDKVIMGYSNPSENYFEAVCRWMESRHNWKIRHEWITVFPGIVPAVSNAVNAYTNPEDGVIMLTPVYHPFYDSIVLNNRIVVRSSLLNNDGSYKIDFSDLERKARNPKNKMMILCSPHNPIGRVWTKEELLKIADICLSNDVLIISDEIHFDIIMPGYKHSVLATLSEEISNNCIVCTSPSKTFNLAGMQISNIVIKNPKLQEKFVSVMKRNAIEVHNPLAFAACEIAYTSCASWVDQFIELVDKNRKIIENFLAEYIPSINVYRLEGTYLQWWDCRSLNLNQQELEAFMNSKAYLFFSEGYIFGEEGRGFERINLACPSSLLKESLVRLRDAVESL